MAIAPFFIDVNGYDSYAFDWGLRAEHIAGKILPANFDMQIGFGLRIIYSAQTEAYVHRRISDGIKRRKTAGELFINEYVHLLLYAAFLCLRFGKGVGFLKTGHCLLMIAVLIELTKQEKIKMVALQL